MNKNGKGKAKLLKFWAPWCVPCASMKPTVEAAVYGIDIELVDVNIDEDPDSVREYEVRSIPTLILVNGKEIGRLVGNVSLSEVKKFLDQV